MTQIEAADRRAPVRAPAGEEELRFIRNFHDIFLSIGLVMLALGIGIVSMLALQPVFAGFQGENWRQPVTAFGAVALLDAAIMWALAEVFARTRRLFLPSIVILLAFQYFLLGAVFAAYALLFGHQHVEAIFNAETVEEGLRELRQFPVFLTVAMMLGVLGYYFRMRLPFAMGLGASWLAAAAIAALFYFEPKKVMDNALELHLACGAFLFLLGVFFDARDPQRATRYSDNAFWLHFFAAPVIFTGVTSLIAEKGAAPGETGWAVTTLGVVVVFALISLLINRRALLVSGLLSAGVAIGILFARTGLDGSWTAALTLLALGGAMVLLGGAWHGVRRVLVAPFPKRGLIARIIPPEPPAGEETPAPRR